jgi:hypothetical protein
MSTRINNRGLISGCVVLVSLATSAALFGWCFSLGLKIDPALRFLSPEPDISEAVPACKIEYALTSDEANSVVFVGDSGGACAFDPIEFQRTFGEAAYNLCSEAGLGPVGYLITLKAYLDHHPHAKAVVFCVTPVTMERTAGSLGGTLPARFMKHYEPEIGTVSEWDRFFYFSRVGLESRRSPYDIAVRDKPLKYFETETYSSLRDKFKESRGFNKLIAHGGRPFKEANKEKPILEEWTHAVRIMARLCEERRVLMFIIFSPVRNDMKLVRTFKPLEAWCQSMSAQPSLCVVSPPVTFYADSLMFDSLHANADGACQFSREVAAQFYGVISGEPIGARGVEAFMPVVAKDVQAAIER